jgi:hypothetical protein
MSVKSFIYTSEIDEKTVNELDKIVVQKTEDQEKGFFDSWMNKYNKSSTVRVTSNKSESTKTVVDTAKTYFENGGLVVNVNNGYITYVSYDVSYYYKDDSNYSGNDDWVENVYCANEGFAGVHECIFVTKKEDKLKDVYMEVYNKNPNTFLNLIGYEEEEKDIYELNTGKVMIFNGNTFHKLQSFAGEGCFNFIIVTLYSDNREGYQFDNDE